MKRGWLTAVTLFVFIVIFASCSFKTYTNSANDIQNSEEQYNFTFVTIHSESGSDYRVAMYEEMFVFCDTDGNVKSQFPPDEMLLYKGEYGTYNSQLYKTHLNNQQQQIYNAAIYMHEHSIPCVTFPFEITAENALEIFTIADLDDPIFEKYGLWTPWSYENFSGLIHTTYSLDRKEEINLAILEAEKIVAKMMSKDWLTTDYHKAQYLYNYIIENTTYNDTQREISSSVPFGVERSTIWDVLVNNEAHCEGLSNAISLLYNMAGIKCSTIAYPDYQDIVGHRWNIAMLDGHYYYIDATIGTKGKKELLENEYAGDACEPFTANFSSSSIDCFISSQAKELIHAKDVLDIFTSGANAIESAHVVSDDSLENFAEATAFLFNKNIEEGRLWLAMIFADGVTFDTLNEGLFLHDMDSGIAKPKGYKLGHLSAGQFHIFYYHPSV